jgi:hypothetical protein
VNYISFIEYFATAVLSVDQFVAIAFPFDYEQAEYGQNLFFKIFSLLRNGEKH